MKEFFNKWGRRILGGGQPDEEQSRASGSTAQPGTEKGQTTGSSEPNSQQAGHEKDPARGGEGETPGTWNPDRECLEIKIYEQVLPPESLSTVMIKLSKGQIRIEGTDKVQQPKLTITEMVFADSEPEAINFYKKNYKKNGSGVDVKVDSDSLSVTEKSSSGVVSGGSGSGQIRGVSGRVVVVDSDIEGDIFNMVSGTTVTNGEQTGSSQLAPRRETRVVLKVPVAKNVEGKKPNYQLEVKAGDVKVENTSGGVCNIVVNAGNVHIERYKGEKIELSNQSANVEIYESEGKFSIGAISGNIMIGNSTGSFRISAVSGNITLTNVTFTQDNKISATSGNIQAEVANKRLKVYAETLSGKITTSGSFVVTKDNRPQRGAGGNVDRSVTITGNVDGSVIITGIGGNVYFGTNVFSDGSAGGSIEGRFGEPGDQNNLLTLTTTSGNITIQQAPQIKQ